MAMSEPAGYRILARRLARDLRRLIEIDRQADIDGCDQGAYLRRLARGELTLQRFDAYERSHRKEVTT